MSIKCLFNGLLIFVLGAVLSGCAINPVTGENEITLVSESQEVAIGKKNYAPYRQAQGGDYIVKPEVTRYVQSVGNRLAKVSDRKLPYEFHVLNDSSPNAWALPGGKISINRGLLVELESEAELAAVLAHEIIHAAARHTAQSMERGLFLQGALVAAGVALSDSDYRDVGMMGANIGAQLANQKYSRDDETEADLYGIRYMIRAGYDPAAAVQLQETFVNLAEGREQNWLSGLFASHPPSRARLAANRSLVAELGNPGGDVGKVRYQKAIAHLERTKPAYKAFDEATAALKEGKKEAALKKLNQAIRIEPKEALFYSLRGEIKAAQGHNKAAKKDLDRAVRLNPDYFKPLLVRGITLKQMGDIKGSARDLEKSIGLLPTAEGYYGLGQIANTTGKSNQAIKYFSKAATSKSNVGNRAKEQLVRLDLNNNPSRYVASGLVLTKDGYLVVKVKNTTPLPIEGVRVVVGVKSGSSIHEQAAYRLNRTISAGGTLQVRTKLGPMDIKTARRYSVIVTQARLAE